jgi:D-alanyl-D-alanine carboxypeptidase
MIITRYWKTISRSCLIGLFVFHGTVWAQQTDQSAKTPCSRDGIAAIMREEIDATLKGSSIPGVTLSVYMPTRFSKPLSTAHGWSDFAKRRPMERSDRMLAGSIGKTFYAAAALKLVDLGKLDLDRTIGYYLPDGNIPSAEKVTVRMLLSHRSGYGEYDETFMRDLISDRTRVRSLSDWVGPLRRKPPADPGTFRYSDINFVILAHIIDRVSGTSATDFIRTQFLLPYRLNQTAASDRREIAGLVAGYAGPGNFFGGDSMLESGKLIYNPQFESGGGGYASSAGDLARWITLFGTSTVFSKSRWTEASTATNKDEKTGKGYGLGIHIDETPAGIAYGHSGYIPGYISWARWYEKPSVAIAIQTNTSDKKRLEWDGYEMSDAIALKIEKRCHQ